MKYEDRMSIMEIVNQGNICRRTVYRYKADYDELRKKKMDRLSLSGKLAKGICDMINSHIEYFNKFDKVIVYYDNGQIKLSSILNAVLTVLFGEVGFRKAEPQKYRLF